MNRSFFVRTDSVALQGNELMLEIFCRCGACQTVSFSTQEILNGGTHRCTSCSQVLKLNGLSWEQRVVKI